MSPGSVDVANCLGLSGGRLQGYADVQHTRRPCMKRKQKDACFAQSEKVFGIRLAHLTGTFPIFSNKAIFGHFLGAT